MRRNTCLLLLLFLTSAQICFSQTVKTEKKDEISPELRKEAVAFLRETSAEVGAMRTLENRISFSSEMAGLMWFADEKEARAMYQAVIGDFRQLLARYDAQANAAGDDEESYAPSMMFGGGNNSARKMMKALSVRQQVATSLAEHDPRLALEFYTSVAGAITNPKIRKQTEEGDSYFETQLLTQIAEQDAGLALEYGRKTLTKKINYQTMALLRKIYQKDADKGAAFGEDIVAKLKSETGKDENLVALLMVFNEGAANIDESKEKAGKKPMFSQQSMREIADLLVKEYMKGDPSEGSGAMNIIERIERYSPAGAMQIRRKYGVTTKPPIITSMGPTRGSMMSGDTMQMPPPAPRPSSSPVPSKAASAAEAQKQLMENVQSLGAKQLPKEEREKIIAQARKTIAGLKDPNQKLLALGALAAQVSASGDKETAVQILDESRILIAPSPKNYMEFMQSWMLASSYAQVDAPKAFPILEDAILRLNETIGGAFKVAEFIDVGGEIIEDGEVQVGSFGGGGITRDLTRSLGASNSIIRSLAQSDFARTKDLTNRFDRTEVRILAKMLVLRAVFGNNKAAEENQTYGADMMEP